MQIPLPTPGSMFRVAGSTDPVWFESSGQMTVADFSAALARLGRRFEDFSDIYDFGCGCGRVMRWLRRDLKDSRIYGSDIDEESVSWIQKHIPGVDVRLSGYLPPLSFDDAFFDLVLGYSVFSHLDEDYQDGWLAELRRVTRPGAVLLLTVHGPHNWRYTKASVALPDLNQLEAQLERGFLHWRGDGWENHFPDYYHTSWHLPEYVRDRWSRWFDVLDVLEGQARPTQDMVVLRRP